VQHAAKLAAAYAAQLSPANIQRIIYRKLLLVRASSYYRRQAKPRSRSGKASHMRGGKQSPLALRVVKLEEADNSMKQWAWQGAPALTTGW
jgi:hypothetical protein